jgi:hypothetical protein
MKVSFVVDKHFILFGLWRNDGNFCYFNFVLSWNSEIILRIGFLGFHGIKLSFKLGWVG